MQSTNPCKHVYLFTHIEIHTRRLLTWEKDSRYVQRNGHVFFCEELQCAPHVYEMRAHVQRNNTSAREGSALQHPVCVCVCIHYVT